MDSRKEKIGTGIAQHIRLLSEVNDDILILILQGSDRLEKDRRIVATNREDVLGLISGAPYAFSAPVIGVENDRLRFAYNLMRFILGASRGFVLL